MESSDVKQTWVMAVTDGGRGGGVTTKIMKRMRVRRKEGRTEKWAIGPVRELSW